MHVCVNVSLCMCARSRVLVAQNLSGPCPSEHLEMLLHPQAPCVLQSSAIDGTSLLQ